MSEREELEAEIAAIEQAWLFSEDASDTAGRRRHLATALLSSGYTKGNGELVEAVRTAKKFAEIIATGRAEGDNYRASEIVNICERALSDSEGVASSGGCAGQYLLLKRALYWRPNYSGYTPLKSEAGRYSLEEASARATPRHIRDKYEGPHVYMIAEARADQLAERCKHVDFIDPVPPAQDTQRAERATNGELHGDGVRDDTEAVQERVNAGLTIGDSHE